MLPTLLLVGAGQNRRVWIPIPVLILWPFWILGWVVWLPVAIAGARCAKPLRMALIIMAQLSGLRIDVDSKDGKIQLRII
ncbi:MAG: hypothetical protein JSW50_07265 [Candidatus Latescibacterota bacterium]|nr:MAG: hypothetical protein JSW50_07265 [Candidatus Latescibacterota bacterium]